MQYLVNEDVTTDQQAAVKLGWLDCVLGVSVIGFCLWALTQHNVNVETPKELVVVTKYICVPTPTATLWKMP